jgi:hypothetical protein
MLVLVLVLMMLVLVLVLVLVRWQQRWSHSKELPSTTVWHYFHHTKHGQTLVLL